MDVALAVITDSPFDNCAGILSLVPVPGPVTKPPSANLALFTILTAFAMLERIVAIPDAIVAIPRIPFPDSADTIFAIALPELMAISAKANILLAIANPLSDSPICSVRATRPFVTCSIASYLVCSISISLSLSSFLDSR